MPHLGRNIFQRRYPEGDLELYPWVHQELHLDLVRELSSLANEHLAPLTTASFDSLNIRARDLIDSYELVASAIRERTQGFIQPSRPGVDTQVEATSIPSPTMSGVVEAFDLPPLTVSGTYTGVWNDRDLRIPTLDEIVTAQPMTMPSSLIFYTGFDPLELDPIQELRAAQKKLQAIHKLVKDYDIPAFTQFTKEEDVREVIKKISQILISEEEEKPESPKPQTPIERRFQGILDEISEYEKLI